MQLLLIGVVGVGLWPPLGAGGGVLVHARRGGWGAPPPHPSNQPIR